MDSLDDVRLDKWLWATRLYKTRSLAAVACQAGKVRVNGAAVKPARSVKPGQIIAVHLSDITRTVKVLGLIDRRVSASLVPNYLEDQTPAAEYLKQIERRATVSHRPAGAGRPTKKERRIMEEHGLL